MPGTRRVFHPDPAFPREDDWFGRPDGPLDWDYDWADYFSGDGSEGGQSFDPGTVTDEMLGYQGHPIEGRLAVAKRLTFDPSRWRARFRLRPTSGVAQTDGQITAGFIPDIWFLQIGVLFGADPTDNTGDTSGLAIFSDITQLLPASSCVDNQNRLAWYYWSITKRHPNLHAEDVDIFWLGWSLAPTEIPELGAYEVRHVDGYVSMFLNGDRLMPPVAIPAEYANRDLVGMTWVHGYGPSSWALQKQYGIASDFEVIEWDDDLGGDPPPMAVSNVTTPVKQAAAASITLKMPEGPLDVHGRLAAGTRVTAVVLKATNGNGGTIDPPSGSWSRRVQASQPLSVMRAISFDYVCGGTELPGENVVFPLTASTAIMGGFMFVTEGVHPMLWGQGGGTVNVTTTSAAYPANRQLGRHELNVWVAMTPANIAITPPADMTPMVNMGTAGPGLNFAAAWKVTTLPDGAKSNDVAHYRGPWAGTLASAGTNLAMQLNWPEDPTATE